MTKVPQRRPRRRHLCRPIFLHTKKIRKEDAQRYGEAIKELEPPDRLCITLPTVLRTPEERILRSKPCQNKCNFFFTFDPFETKDMHFEFQAKQSTITFANVRIYLGSSHDIFEIFKRILYIIPNVNLAKIFKIIPSYEDKEVLNLSNNLKANFSIDIYKCIFTKFYRKLFTPDIISQLVHHIGY